jgi:lipopolysaccharide biosynthesis regulator YciM
MVLDPNDSTRMLSIDAKTYKGGSLGSPGVIGVAGKEPTVGKKQEAKETAQNNASAIIAKLRQSYDRLDELGGITSTENRAGTNISARMGASPVGQTVGSFFGTKTQAERDKIEQTRPLLMTTIMQAMGLSAKQLDSNAELKLWLSSATDPTKSLEANREALNELERLLTGEGKSAGAKAKRPLAFKPTSDLFNAADAIIGK